VHSYIRIYIHTYVCNMYVHTYIHTYIYIHTQTWVQEKIKVSGDEQAHMNSLQELHEKLQEVEKEMKDHTDKYYLLTKQRTEMDEHLQVLNKASEWFGQVGRAGIEFPAPPSEERRNEMSSLLEDGGEGAGGASKRLSMLGHLAGCIPTANLNDFRMTLFRATRGNMHLQHQVPLANVLRVSTVYLT